MANALSLRDQFLANVGAEMKARNVRMSPAMADFLACVAEMEDEAFQRTALAIIADARPACAEGV